MANEMKINRKAFFDNWRERFGRLQQPLVNSLNEILDAIDNEPRIQDARMVGCVFGNSAIESNWTFQPVIEGYWIKKNRIQKLYNYYKLNNPGALKTIFPNGAKEPAYYGRGRVTQTTHISNYARASEEIFGDDRLVKNPDLILVPETDLKVAFLGMLEGWFTGKKLSDYFNDTKTDYRGSRKIINGVDRASEIASIAIKVAEGVVFVESETAMQGYKMEDYLT